MCIRHINQHYLLTYLILDSCQVSENENKVCVFREAFGRQSDVLVA